MLFVTLILLLSRYGLPVVRRFLQYHELLRDIRLERVKEVMYFTHPYDLDPDPPFGHPEGPCLVVYRCCLLARRRRSRHTAPQHAAHR